jgi:hypothetical protein
MIIAMEKINIIKKWKICRKEGQKNYLQVIFISSFVFPFFPEIYLNGHK